MPDTSRPAPGRREDYRAFVAVPTRWADNDMYGHLNNAATYSFFDTAVTSWLIGEGLTAHPGDSMFFVAETGCRYHAEIGYPDRIEVGLRVDRLGTSSVSYGIALFREGEGTAAAEGIFVHVHVDRLTRRPAPLPGPARQAMEGILA
ncbi:thioesterase family protein [Aureimonas sp. AU4]|uniref:acyl-CoA thioesterase n=1 Tax=Aureimonas sp. AU4 TaxID=1638163 RepID=UPI0007818F40|nr:thioesterase family protein [Aureimonas sp. AU4]